MVIGSGTSWSNPVTIAGYPGDPTPVLTCPSTCDALVNIVSSHLTPNLQYVIFDGLKFDGVNVIIGAVISVGFGPLPAASHIRFINNDIYNLPGGYGVQTGADSTDIQFINNKIHDSFAEPERHNGGTVCGQAICWGYPFYWSSSNGLIEGNEIYNIPSWAVHMYNSTSPYPSNNVVRENKIYNFGSAYPAPPGSAGPSDARGTGILLGSGTNNLAYNNVIWNGSQGIASGNGSSGSTAHNNTIYGMLLTGIQTAFSSGAVYRNNIVVNSGSTNIDDTFAGSAVTYSDNLCFGTGGTRNCQITDQDPLFVDAARADFRLSAASPAIGAGPNVVSSEGITSDLGGTVGPAGSNPNCDQVGNNFFVGCYYNDRNLNNLVMVQDSGSIDFDWDDGSPGSAVPSDNFSARWQGDFDFSSGQHDFVVTADDGVRLYIDGELVLDRWIDQAPTTYTVGLSLSAGTHRILLEYYENGGGALAKLSFDPLPPGDTAPDTSITSAPPALSTVTPRSLDFGAGAIGKRSAEQVVTVKNDGTANLSIASIKIVGANKNQFSKPTDKCTNKTLAPGGSCTVSVRFKPTSSGAKAATVTIPSNDPDENPANVSLSGTGTP
jgi:hypothetical protein